MKKYRKLNEVLIEWNKSFKEDSDNIFLKSKDIKESLERYFVYRLDEKEPIRVFCSRWWGNFEEYRNKVWVNNKHVELDNYGWTVDEFEPGEYGVYIEDIDKIIDISYMFSECKQLVSAFIPNSVTVLGDNAFASCISLSSITIPNSVTAIDDWAFYCCTSLRRVTIPNSVTSIGLYAFWGCSGLTSVTIQNSVTSIGNYAFSACSSLTRVTIPSSVKVIGTGAFHNCINLKFIHIKDINKFNQIQFGNKTADPRWYGAKVIELKK